MEETGAAEAHIAGIEPERRREEARALDRIFREVTGFRPLLWSGRMVGYGRYDYTYESGRSGSFLATGFAVSPRQVTVYVMPGYTPFPEIMARLGPCRLGKSCLYLTRLADADETALRDLIAAGLADLATRWPVAPT